MKKNAITIESGLDTLYLGDHIFSAEFISDEKGEHFDIKEYEFINYLDKNVHIEGIEIENANPAELFDVRFPKVKIKTDISCGFFKSAKEAAKEFVDMIEHIAKKARETYNKEFND